MSTNVKTFLIGVLFMLFMTIPVMYTSKVRTPKELIRLILTWLCLCIMGGFVALLFMFLFGG